MQLEPGDLILVKSRGAVYAAARRLTGNDYDHVAVVVSGGQTINIDKPGSKYLPQERLLKPSHEPVVLRPAWPNEEARDRFVAWIQRCVERDYDVRRTLRLIPRLLLRKWLRVVRPLERPSADRSRWICTDAVLLGLEQSNEAFRALERLPLDWVSLGCGTTRDFLVIHEKRPDLLARIPP